jgi:hypothetical protein
VVRLFGLSRKSTLVTRIVPVLVLAALLCSMAPAFAPSLANAQNEDITTPTAEVQEIDDGASPDTLEEAPAETPESTETPVPTETPVAETETSAGGFTSYVAEARVCPPGFEPAGSDAATALATCVDPVAGIGFTLATQESTYPGDTRATGDDGVAAWLDIPLATGYSVTAAVPQGAGDPWVSCELTGGATGKPFVAGSSYPRPRPPWRPRPTPARRSGLPRCTSRTFFVRSTTTPVT